MVNYAKLCYIATISAVSFFLLMFLFKCSVNAVSKRVKPLQSPGFY